jgi:hypothetical protein
MKCIILWLMVWYMRDICSYLDSQIISCVCALIFRGEESMWCVSIHVLLSREYVFSIQAIHNIFSQSSPSFWDGIYHITKSWLIPVHGIAHSRNDMRSQVQLPRKFLSFCWSTFSIRASTFSENTPFQLLIHLFRKRKASITLRFRISSSVSEVQTPIDEASFRISGAFFFRIFFLRPTQGHQALVCCSTKVHPPVRSPVPDHGLEVGLTDESHFTENVVNSVPHPHKNTNLSTIFQVRIFLLVGQSFQKEPRCGSVTGTHIQNPNTYSEPGTHIQLFMVSMWSSVLRNRVVNNYFLSVKPSGKYFFSFSV